MKLSKIALLSVLVIGLVGGVSANDMTIETYTFDDTDVAILDIDPDNIQATFFGVDWLHQDVTGSFDTIELRIYDPSGNLRDSRTRPANDEGFGYELDVNFDEGGTWEVEAENLDKGYLETDTFEVEEAEAEPTVTATGPDDGESFSPDTLSIEHSANIDRDGADEVDVTLEIDGVEGFSIDDYSADSITVSVQDPGVDYNAGDTYNYEWTVEADGNTDSDSKTYSLDEWDITLSNLDPDGDTFSFSDRNIDYSVDLSTNADDLDLYTDAEGNFDLDLQSTGFDDINIDLDSEGTYSVTRETVGVDQQYVWDAEIEGVQETETATVSVEEPSLSINLESPVDGSSFEWDTENVDHDFLIEGEGQDVTYELIRDGVVEVTDTTSTDSGQQTLTTETLPTDTGESYDWSVEIEDYYNTETSETWSYSIDSPDLDVEFIQPEDGEVFEWDTDEVLHEIEVTADGQEVDVQIVRNGTEILNSITEVDGVQSFASSEPVDRDTYYEWGYEVEDDYNFGEIGSSSYSVEDAEEVTLSNEDVTPDRVKEGDTVEFSITASSVDVDVNEVIAEYDDQTVDLLQSGDEWSREHTVPSTVSDGEYDVTFTSVDEVNREESTTIEDGIEIDNTPLETTSIFIEWSEDGISILSSEFDNNVIYYISFDEPFEELGEVTFESTDLDLDITEDKSEWTEVDLSNENPNVEDISYYQSGQTIDVMYVTDDLGDREEEISGSTTYTDDLGNSDSFSQTFVVDNIEPRLSNFQAENLDRATDFYVQGDEIEFSIDVEDFSDVNVNFFNDAFSMGISGTESDGTWTGTSVVNGDVEALEEDDVEVEAIDEFGNEEIEFYSSGLEQADDIEILSQSIEVEENEINHSITTNTQLQSITAELGSETVDIQDYTETDTGDGFLYEIDNLVSDDGYFTLNEISVEDSFGQTTSEDVPEHLVDTTNPTVEPRYYGSFESGTEPRGEVVSNDGEISWSNLGVSDNVALQEVEIEINGEVRHTETFDLEDEVTFYDEDLSFEMENNEYHTVEMTALDHRGNTATDTTEIYVFEAGDIPIQSVEWTEDTLYREQSRELNGDEYYVTNKLEIEIEDVEYDWFSRSFGNRNDIRFELDGQYVSRPGYGQSVSPPPEISGGWATKVGDEVLYRNADFTTTFEDVGDKRWFSNVTSFIYFDEDGVETDEAFSYESIEQEEDTVTYIYEFDMVDDTDIIDRYNERINGEVEGFVRLVESGEEVVVSDTFKLEEKIEVNNLRIKSDVEDVNSKISFNNNFDDLRMEDLIVLKDVRKFSVGYGREYAFDGSDWVLVEETSDLREPTGSLENPVAGDKKWNFTIVNQAEEEIEVLYDGETIATIESEGEKDLTCEAEIGCFGETEDSFLGETFSSTSLEVLYDRYTAKETVYSESQPELSGEYETDSFPVERGEFEARFNLFKESTDLEREVSKSFEVRENTFKGKFYQFFENNLDWSDNFTSAILLIASVIGGMVLVSIYLGFFPATMFGIGVGIGWLYLGFLPLTFELTIVVALAGILTIFFRWVKG